MKALIFGDVHGNLVALEEMLKKEKGNFDLMVCHGDVVNYGPWSNECVQVLSDLKCICLLGNHESAYLAGFYPGTNPLVKDFFRQTYKHFNQFEKIGAYKNSHHVGSYCITHTINNKYYYPDSDLSHVKLEMNTVIGHSHYAFHKELANAKTLTNTGSVGQNRASLNIINYVLVDIYLQVVEVKEILYDPAPVIHEMKVRGYPKNCVDYYASKAKA